MSGTRCPNPTFPTFQRQRSSNSGPDYVDLVESRLGDHQLRCYPRGTTARPSYVEPWPTWPVNASPASDRCDDRAWAYRYSLHKARHQPKARGPHCLWQNRKTERFSRTPAAQWRYQRSYTTNDDRAAALAPWPEHYNTEQQPAAHSPAPLQSPECHQLG